MHSYKLLTFIGFSLLLAACGNNVSSKKSNFSIKINSDSSIISNAETLTIELLNPKNIAFDSIQLTMDTKKITSFQMGRIAVGNRYRTCGRYPWLAC